MSNELTERQRELERTWQLLQNANKDATERVNRIVWAALGITLTIIGVLGGMLYNGIVSRVEDIEREMARRAFTIQDSESVNKQQERELSELREEMRRLRSH